MLTGQDCENCIACYCPCLQWPLHHRSVSKLNGFLTSWNKLWNCVLRTVLNSFPHRLNLHFYFLPSIWIRAPSVRHHDHVAETQLLFWDAGLVPFLSLFLLAIGSVLQRVEITPRWMSYTISRQCLSVSQPLLTDIFHPFAVPRIRNATCVQLLTWSNVPLTSETQSRSSTCTQATEAKGC